MVLVRSAAVLAVMLPVTLLAEPRVGVVVIGPDSVEVAAAQKAIEAKIAAAPATVRGAELGPVLAGPQPLTANAWSKDSAARAGFDAALAEARKSYFSDLMPQASAKLDEAAAIVDRSLDVPGAIRVKVPLWRAAVALRKNQKDTAASEVNVALLLVPNLVPEPNSPPPVVALLAEIRARSPKPFRVQVNGVPANAVVKVDDVAFATDSIAVFPGAHVLDVTAPGFRPYNTAFDAKGDLSLTVVLVPAIGAAWEKMFDAIVARGDVAEGDRKSIDALVAREKLDMLVMATVKAGETKGVLWKRAESAADAASGADAAEFGAWAAQQVAARPAAVASPSPTAVALVIATPSVTATPVATPSGAGTGRGVHVAVEAGVAFARWDRAVDPESGAGYEVPGLSGGGPRVRVAAGRGRGPRGEVELSYLTFGEMAVTDPDDDSNTVNVPGGSLIQARAGMGWTIGLGRNAGERATTITPSVGGFYESHTAADFPGEDVFASHTRTGADVRVTANIAAGRAGIIAEVGVAPFSTWSEDPDGMTGKDPAPGVAPKFRVGADLPAGRHGRLVIDASGEMRTVQYSGAGDSGLQPVDAKREELLLSLGLSFRYRF